MYNEETQDEINSAIVETGLIQGRYLYPTTDSVLPNCLIETLEDGPVWYGDLDYAELDLLSGVAKSINKTLRCQSQTNLTQFVQVSP